MVCWLRPPLRVSVEQRALLERWVGPTHGIPKCNTTRAPAALMGMSRPIEIVWRRPFAEGGPAAVRFRRPRRVGRKCARSPPKRSRISWRRQRRVCHRGRRTGARARWPRSRASARRGQRIWHAFGLQPHRVRLQALDRPAVRREGARHRGAVPEPAGSRRWCCAWTRRARSRRWIAPSRSCR